MISLTINNKYFRERKILQNVAINLFPGDFLVLTGPSGAGKSTLLNIIGLLDNNYKGEYFISNSLIDVKCLKTISSLREKYFGYVFQDSLINEKQSIMRNLLCSVDYKKQKVARKNAAHVLEMVGLDNFNVPTSVLSGGEKQRLALARALIKKPSVLLADEPTASLDKNNKKKVMNILDEFRTSGGIVVMVTHDIDLITPEMNILKIETLD
ncbi:TPA: ATP-binding cassette domain-containing protein [Escherichia coli]|uniref:ABC transporter ATP-binding protein n=1 Tax=Escherichia coli TaxID=562 RepID=UPI00388D1A55|nr:ATP-binding cassette domain-containing protein [Escherichia coli]HCB2839931.1 ATP-binding cassette domain-containing protein [Escherichia coli]